MTTATIPFNDFREAIEQAGLTPPSEILPDGQFHRFASNGDPDDDAGWYKLHSDGLPAGAFGCFRSLATQKWCAKSDQQMTPAERTATRSRIDKIQRQREAAERRLHTDAAAHAQTIWDQAAAAPAEHPYLLAKQVQPHGLRVDAQNRLIVPVLIDGAITSLQFIPPDGQDKKFLFGGAVKGGHFAIGDIRESETVVICVCEGFSTGASIHEAMGQPVIVAFHAGNLKPVAMTLREQYPPTTILVCGDNDIYADGKENTGRLAATAAAKAIGGILAVPELDGLKCDWNDLGRMKGLEMVRQEIQAAIELSLTSSSNTATTTSPTSPVEPWPALDSAALHGLAGEAIQLFDPHTEADRVAVLVSVLAEIGTMVGRNPHLILDGSYHPLLFWPVLVGKTSKSRKGTAEGRSDTLCRLADPLWTRGAYKGTLSSGEGLVYAVRDALYEDQPVKEKGRLTGETVRILVDRGIDDKRLCLVQSEFGAVLRVMARDGNSLSGVLRDAWDGKTLTPMTKTHRVTATAPHIGIVGHVTHDELLRNLTSTDVNNGFGNRFGWFAVRRSKELPFSSAPDAHALQDLADRIGARLQVGRAMGQLQLDASAREAWGAVYHDLSADRPGLAGVLLGRAEAQVMRLSALYAVLDGTAQMTVVHLRAALALWTYAEQSVALLFGDSTGDADADTILEVLRRDGEQTDTQISAIFGYNRSRAQLDRAKVTLQTAGLAAGVERKTGGRPVRVWRATSINRHRPGDA